MKIKILKKKYPANVKNKANTVLFELDGKQIYIDILYIDSPTLGKRNVFIDNNRYEEIEEYINKNCNFSFEDFKETFLYELRKYSKGRNLDIVGCKTLNKEE